MAVAGGAAAAQLTSFAPGAYPLDRLFLTCLAVRLVLGTQVAAAFAVGVGLYLVHAALVIDARVDPGYTGDHLLTHVRVLGFPTEDDNGARFVVAGVDDPDGGMPPVVVINPEITPVGSAMEEDWEGCLSIPDLRGRVPRATDIRVTAFDRFGIQVSMTASGFPARVIQHETDHLDGVLFLDRMDSFESLTFLQEYGRYWDKEDAPVSGA